MKKAAQIAFFVAVLVGGQGMMAPTIVSHGEDLFDGPLPSCTSNPPPCQ